MVLSSIALVVVGLALLYVGGEALVRGATRLAERLGIRPAVVGLTVVAAGTSMPELVVSVDAAVSGNTAVAVGNVVGSNIFNIGAILGLSALFAPLRVQQSAIRVEWPVMFMAACQLHLLARDGVVDRIEGGFFILGLSVFLMFLVRSSAAPQPHRGVALPDDLASDPASDPASSETASTSPGRIALFILIGCGLLVAGGQCLVRGSVELAAMAGLSETVIGLTVVAAGTSLPELAASIVATARGQDDIAIGNVIGSNIFNVFGILGVTAVIRPLPIHADVLTRDNLWMLGFSVALLPLMRSGARIRRAEGALMLGAFLVYLGLLLGGY